MRPDPCIEPWRGETLELLPGVTLIRGGGHFPGGAMLHWAAGAEGRGVVCSADIATVNLDRKSFTFMRSYPEQYPLSEKGVRAIGAALAPFQFDRVYSHFFDRVDPGGRKADSAGLDRALCRGHRRCLRSGVMTRCIFSETWRVNARLVHLLDPIERSNVFALERLRPDLLCPTSPPTTA